MPRSRTYYAYIRVSTTRQGQEGASLQAQRTAIERYAAAHQLQIDRWFEEQVTAAKRGRPIFKSMLRMVRAGRARGILVHKIDRSARNLHDWARFADLADSGVEIHFCHEQLDLTSRSGRLSADIQAVVAADYIRNLRQEAIKGMQARLESGLWPWRAPIGYLDMGGGKPKKIDPEIGPAVARLFRLYATGDYNLRLLQEEAVALGVENLKGAALSLTSLSKILNNPFYCGRLLVRSTGDSYRGQHEALVEVATWNRVREVLQGRLSPRIHRHEFAFRCLLKCEQCGRSLTGEMQKGHVYYRCHGLKCKGVIIKEDLARNELARLLGDAKIPSSVEPLVRSALERAAKRESNTHDTLRATLQLELGQIRARLDRITDVYLDGDLERPLFQRRKAAELDRERACTQRLDAMNSAAPRSTAEISLAYAACQNLARLLKMAPATHTRDVARNACSNLVVNGKKLVLVPSPAILALQNLNSVLCCEEQRGAVRTSKASLPVSLGAGVVEAIDRLVVILADAELPQLRRE